MTWVDAINTIIDADILVCHGRKPTVDEVYYHDPNGELYMISYWYWLACRILGKPLPEMEEYFREEHERMYQAYLSDPTVKEDITPGISRKINLTNT